MAVLPWMARPRIGKPKAVHHKNGDMTAECCECARKQRHRESAWAETWVCLDFKAFVCPDCQQEEQDRGAPQNSDTCST